MSARICKHEGCGRSVRARGMCNVHHSQWLRANPGLRETLLTENLVLKCMPGTIRQLQDSAGLTWPAVRRALDVMTADGRAHVGDHQPPLSASQKWQPIYQAGPGETALLTKRMRDEHARAGKNQRYARRQAHAKVAGMPKAAGWAATLMMGIEHREVQYAEA